MKKDNSLPKMSPVNGITRKEAIVKAGKYAAFTAATMMLLMSPAANAATMQSPMKPKRH